MRRQTWYWWAALLASSLTTGFTAVAISLHAQAESDRKFCTLITTQDDAWSETTPTTVTGKRVAEAMRQLRRDLDCPPE
ncbi:hypothetical protein GCM10010168_85760 [Actinoplanes ianthinogenes]|uniref:Secreted protein n=1 Tax=Actinoplanes ianthinogenes TaxID=122358 RepID=A0ABM7M136_9ACTN|nr:hypothetical protein [Actinoplanes ianthinogenes]BCJ45307.1 hypothetical protein Aiant_59640 [Actinoplanes ianthinogenes]GGR53687.1 hypothetical protein GCM10010168_85760 [Actinoplanes ianthinogenes]